MTISDNYAAADRPATQNELAEEMTLPGAMSRTDGNRLLMAFFSTAAEGLAADGTVKINQLGTFAVTPSGDVAFTPSEAFSEAVNKPFTCFAPVKAAPDNSTDSTEKLNSTDSIDSIEKLNSIDLIDSIEKIEPEPIEPEPVLEPEPEPVPEPEPNQPAPADVIISAAVLVPPPYVPRPASPEPSPVTPPPAQTPVAPAPMDRQKGPIWLWAIVLVLASICIGLVIGFILGRLLP